MNRFFALLTFLILSGISLGQTIQFNRIPGALPIRPNVADVSPVGGTSDIGDIDGDGDIDLVISGGGVTYMGRTIIYRNDGNGNFYKNISANLDSVSSSGAKLFDSDADGDLDLLIIGRLPNSQVRASFYKNDGNGNFTLQLNSSILGASDPDINVFDSDGDGDLDLLITGRKFNNNYEADLYLNNGFGVFSLSIGHPFSGINGTMTEVTDVNGDGKPDITMRIQGGSPGNTFTRLYLNLGTQYIENPLVTFNNNRGTFKYADVDNDGDQDVLFLNYVHNNTNTSELYLNNGSGSFTLTSPNIMGLYTHQGGIEFFDYDNDNELDLLISGTIVSSTDTTILYQNNSGIFTAVNNNGLDIGTYAFQALPFDFDGDNLNDLFLFGTVNHSARKSVLFHNAGNGLFEEVSGNSVLGVGSGGAVFGDLDNDGDEDMIAHGYRDHYTSSTKIYLNDGLGNYTETPSTLPDMLAGNIELADLDGDGDLDVALTGLRSTYYSNSFYSRAGVYLNNGSAQFSLHPTFVLPKIHLPSLKLADVDNDGDEDIVHFGGTINSLVRYANIYLNNGLGSFTLNSNNGLPPCIAKDFHFEDFDNDNDLDVIIAASSTQGEFIDVYLNNGSGQFTAKNGVGFSNFRQANIGVGDINQDGFLDAVVVGYDSIHPALTQVGINDGTGSFVLDTLHNLPHLKHADIRFADIDNDNREDIILQGRLRHWELMTNFYLNIGNGKFKVYRDSTLAEAYDGTVVFADIDNDNDLDLAQFGFSENRDLLGRIYRNGCGSYRDTTTISVCKNYLWKGNSYNQTGVFFDTTTNSNGCDSLHVLNLVVLSNASQDSISACSSFQWINGQVYSTSGTYYDTLTNISGCDSILELNLTVNQISRKLDTVLMCDADYYVWNGDSLRTSGIYSDTLTNSNGCDSIVQLDLSLESPLISSFADTACQQYFWSRTALSYTTSGLYYDTVSNVNGCDSIFALDLTIGNSSYRQDSISACDDYYWAFNGKTYTTTGVYLDTIVSSLGCDSVAELTLMVSSSSGSLLFDSACYSYNWNNRNLTQTGRYFDTLVNKVGCDSIVTLDLTIKKLESTYTVDTLCTSFTWLRNGRTYYNSGTYYDTVANPAGCDSMHTLELSLNTFDTTLTKNNFRLTANQSNVFYQWIDCVKDSILFGDTLQTYEAEKNGVYAVILTGRDKRCIDTSQCIQVTGVGLNEFKVRRRFNIYPNPSNGLIYIEFEKPSPSDHLAIEIKDIRGKLIQQFRLENESVQMINLQHLSKGMYLISIGNHVEKLIIAD